MKNRLVLVINPRSSGFDMIKKKILPHLKEVHFQKNQLTTFEIQPTSPIENAQEMAKGLRDGDIILVAGGDGTAHIATNAAVISGQKNLRFKYTGFGNFNDYAQSFSRNSGRAAIESFRTGEIKDIIKPLEIRINGEFFRYAPLYTTLGLTAEMAEIFEGKRLRRALKKVRGRNRRLILSLTAATRFYFKKRKAKTLQIRRITLDSQSFPNITSPATDLVFMNGPRMARIMRCAKNRHTPDTFGFAVLNASQLFKNLPFLISGIFGKIPLKRIKSAKIEFLKSANIWIQIEGEAVKLKKVKTIEINICDTEIKIL